MTTFPLRSSLLVAPGLALAVGVMVACAAPSRAPQAPLANLAEAEFARKLGAELAEKCPQAAPDDAQARERCADALTHLSALDSKEPLMLWGAQAELGNFDLSASQTTRFDPFVWRRMYLSTFMFSSRHRLEHAGGRSILHVPVHFRYALDPGEYPYPFWHSEDKWRSYQQTEELLFFLEGGRVVAALRSAQLDVSRKVVAHACEGCVEWDSDPGRRPRVALYRFMFSAQNPHVTAVDESYRAFERAQRQADCMSCHSPSNPAQMNPLELFSYPNHALSERKMIVQVLEHNHMPPATENQPAGIADEAYRAELVGLARAFAAAGDRAIEFEKRAAASRGQ
jgi:hypothetical protein